MFASLISCLLGVGIRIASFDVIFDRLDDIFTVRGLV